MKPSASASPARWPRNRKKSIKAPGFASSARGLYLLAAKVVARPADRHFQYGYAHIEPLVNSFNNLILLVVCLYALFNGLEGLRTGGNPVDVGNVVIYSLLSAAVCTAVWIHERCVAARCDPS